RLSSPPAARTRAEKVDCTADRGTPADLGLRGRIRPEPPIQFEESSPSRWYAPAPPGSSRRSDRPAVHRGPNEIGLSLGRARRNEFLRWSVPSPAPSANPRRAGAA